MVAYTAMKRNKECAFASISGSAHHNLVALMLLFIAVVSCSAQSCSDVSDCATCNSFMDCGWCKGACLPSSVCIPSQAQVCADSSCRVFNSCLNAVQLLAYDNQFHSLFQQASPLSDCVDSAADFWTTHCNTSSLCNQFTSCSQCLAAASVVSTAHPESGCTWANSSCVEATSTNQASTCSQVTTCPACFRGATVTINSAQAFLDNTFRMFAATPQLSAAYDLASSTCIISTTSTINTFYQASGMLTSFDACFSAVSRVFSSFETVEPAQTTLFLAVPAMIAVFVPLVLGVLVFLLLPCGHCVRARLRLRDIVKRLDVRAEEEQVVEPVQSSSTTNVRNSSVPPPTIQVALTTPPDTGDFPSTAEADESESAATHAVSTLTVPPTTDHLSLTLPAPIQISSVAMGSDSEPSAAKTNDDSEEPAAMVGRDDPEIETVKLAQHAAAHVIRTKRNQSSVGGLALVIMVFAVLVSNINGLIALYRVPFLQSETLLVESVADFQPLHTPDVTVSLLAYNISCSSLVASAGDDSVMMCNTLPNASVPMCLIVWRTFVSPGGVTSLRFTSSRNTDGLSMQDVLLSASSTFVQTPNAPSIWPLACANALPSQTAGYLQLTSPIQLFVMNGSVVTCTQDCPQGSFSVNASNSVTLALTGRLQYLFNNVELTSDFSQAELNGIVFNQSIQQSVDTNAPQAFVEIQLSLARDITLLYAYGPTINAWISQVIAALGGAFGQYVILRFILGWLFKSSLQRRAFVFGFMFPPASGVLLLMQAIAPGVNLLGHNSETSRHILAAFVRGTFALCNLALLVVPWVYVLVLPMYFPQYQQTTFAANLALNCLCLACFYLTGCYCYAAARTKFYFAFEAREAYRTYHSEKRRHFLDGLLPGVVSHVRFGHFSLYSSFAEGLGFILHGIALLMYSWIRAGLGNGLSSLVAMWFGTHIGLCAGTMLLLACVFIFIISRGASSIFPLVLLVCVSTAMVVCTALFGWLPFSTVVVTDQLFSIGQPAILSTGIILPLCFALGSGALYLNEGSVSRTNTVVGVLVTASAWCAVLVPGIYVRQRINVFIGDVLINLAFVAVSLPSLIEILVKTKKTDAGVRLGSSLALSLIGPFALVHMIVTANVRMPFSITINIVLLVAPVLLLWTLQAWLTLIIVRFPTKSGTGVWRFENPSISSVVTGSESLGSRLLDELEVHL